MSDLGFEDAKVDEGFKNEHLEVGNHKVVFSEVMKDKSSQKGSPFVSITVQDQAGLKCEQRYYLNGGAWNISRSAILTLVMAAHGADLDNAKALLVGLNTENIDTRLATLLVGKKVGITLNGEWINPSDAEKKSWVKSTFGSYKFAVPVAEFNDLSDKKYIKEAPDNRAANGGSSASAAPADGVIPASTEAW